ncbi:MAG: YkgJ family cysteine cluster protein [Desulfovibrionaceae bacterium]
MILEKEQSPVCRRCGICCSKGGPALHIQDAPLVGDALPMHQLMTLRLGEMVYDQPLGKVVPLVEEIIKVRSAPDSSACVFFNADTKSCAVYENRPAECRVLLCENTDALRAMYEKDRLNRDHLLPQGHPLRALLEDHDQRSATGLLVSLARKITEGDQQAVNHMGEIIAYDEELRRLLPEKTGLDPETMNFLLGRPVAQILRGFGLEAIREDGHLLLRKRPARF